jgi:hypothetical protein
MLTLQAGRGLSRVCCQEEGSWLTWRGGGGGGSKDFHKSKGGDHGEVDMSLVITHKVRMHPSLIYSVVYNI